MKTAFKLAAALIALTALPAVAAEAQAPASCAPQVRTTNLLASAEELKQSTASDAAAMCAGQCCCQAQQSSQPMCAKAQG